MDDKGAGVMAAFGLPPSHDNDPGERLSGRLLSTFLAGLASGVG